MFEHFRWSVKSKTVAPFNSINVEKQLCVLESMNFVMFPVPLVVKYTSCITCI